MPDDPEYEAWLRTIPPEISTDPIWRMTAYRLSPYLLACAQSDLQYLAAHRASRPHIDQLLRAVGGISASLDEGYSRFSGRERAHYYEYSLGSARESRGWYFKCRAAFRPERIATRLALLSRIIRILTAVVPREREAADLRPKPQQPRPENGLRGDDPAASSSS